MSTPHTGNFVRQRQQKIRLPGDVAHREIVRDRSVGQDAVGQRDQGELQQCGRACGVLPSHVVTQGARQRQRALDKGHAGREDQGEVAKFNNHLGAL